jgi:hypothetical protein
VPGIGRGFDGSPLRGRAEAGDSEGGSSSAALGSLSEFTQASIGAARPGIRRCNRVGKQRRLLQSDLKMPTPYSEEKWPQARLVAGGGAA